jgi:3-phenylpropionate/cinnamic acid dioxygenase small subunit
MTPIEEANLLQRLQRLEDMQAIGQLFIDYGHYLDAGDFGAYSQLFSAEGEVQLGPIGRAQGQGNIQALMEKALGAQVGASYHLISGPIITLEGDHARSEVMWTVLVRNDGGLPTVTATGRHRDELVRENGQWRFKRRRGYVDLPSRKTMP